MLNVIAKRTDIGIHFVSLQHSYIPSNLLYRICLEQVYVVCCYQHFWQQPYWGEELLLLLASQLYTHRIKPLEQNQQPAGEQAQQDQEFIANLTGDSEVPPVTTNSSGSAEFELNDDGDEMSYDLDAEDITEFSTLIFIKEVTVKMDP